MNIADIMLGDWISYNGHPMQVDNILLDRMAVQASRGAVQPTNRGFHYYRITEIVDNKDIKPVDITKEILEKNGFVGNQYAILGVDNGKYLEYYYHESRLREWWIGIDEWQHHSKVKDLCFQANVFYVHELQHALRLCGIEKDIIL